MRSILSLAFIGLFGTSAGFAADAIIQRDDPVPVAPVVAAPAKSYHWSGIYLGVDGGYKWNSLKFDPNSVAKKAGIKGDAFKMNSTFGGVYLGYNYQIDNWVIGAEGDAQLYFGGKDKAAASGNGRFAASRGFGSARVRLGYAMDRFLPYVTGGAAFENLEISSKKDGKVVARDNKTRVGYTLGAGLDYAITDKWIGKVEYQFMDFGKKSYDLNIGSADLSSHSHTMRVGLSYKF